MSSLTTAGFTIFTNGQATLAYQAVNVTPDLAKGTVALFVANCQRVRQEGAVVTLSPAPQKLAYSGGAASPLPSTSLTATSNNGVVFGFNQPTGKVTISTMTKDGLYTPRTMSVVAGSASVFAPLQP